jgi:hypothetical protein
VAEQNIKTLTDLTKDELITELKARDELIQKLLRTNEEQDLFIKLITIKEV